MNTFSKFNKTLTEQQKTVISVISNNPFYSSQYPEPVNGIYVAKLDRLEVAPKKGTGFPCFFMTMKLIEGAEAETEAFLVKWPGTGNPKIFRTLSLYGTKDDAKCIGSAIGLASKLHENTKLLFNGDYDQLAADIKALREKIDNSYAYLVDYSREDFNHIRILEIFRSNIDETAQQTTTPETVSNGYPQQFNEYNGYSQFDGEGFLPMDEPDAKQKPTSFPHLPKFGVDLDDDEELPFSL